MEGNSPMMMILVVMSDENKGAEIESDHLNGHTRRDLSQGMWRFASFFGPASLCLLRLSLV